MKTTFRVSDKGRKPLRQAITALNQWVKAQADETELSFSLSATVNDEPIDEAVARTGKLFGESTPTEGEA